MCYRVQPTFPKPLIIFFSKFSIFHYFKKWVPQSLFSWILTKQKKEEVKSCLVFDVSIFLHDCWWMWISESFLQGMSVCQLRELGGFSLSLPFFLPFSTSHHHSPALTASLHLSSSLPSSYCLSPPLIITPRLLLLQTFFPNLLLHHILPSSFHQYILSPIKSTNNDALHCYDFFWHPHI